VKNFLLLGAQKIYSAPTVRPDLKFFDPENIWYVYNNDRLRASLKEFLSQEPIATTHEEKQPRLLIFSVDVAEGATVTFDSYPKVDGSRMSQYSNCEEREEFRKVIRYPGITIDHVMASGSLPMFYDYSKVPIDQTSGNKDSQNNMPYFWDGGLLSNTPLKELLQAHREYWEEVRNTDEIPDLEVYIVNVHPSKMDSNSIPFDYDGVQDRYNDIVFGDRSSDYDAGVTNLVADYYNLAVQLNHLLTDTINTINNETNKARLQKEFDDVLARATTTTKNGKEKSSTYRDLLARRKFKITKLTRIQRTDYDNNIHGKIGDFTVGYLRRL
jgi:NTE family protein